MGYGPDRSALMAMYRSTIRDYNGVIEPLLVLSDSAGARSLGCLRPGRVTSRWLAVEFISP